MPRRKDLPSRPPTPYPFPSDPTWGAIKELRGDHRPGVKQRRDAVRVTERIIYRHVAPHEIYRKLPGGHDRRDAAPGPPATPDSMINNRRGWAGLVRGWACRSAIGIPNHQDVQRQILAQNERIAGRPLPASRPGRAGQKTVHFKLPRDEENRRPWADLVGRFERLQVEEPCSARCSLCGQRLSCRGCRNFASIRPASSPSPRGSRPLFLSSSGASPHSFQPNRPLNRRSQPF